MNCPGDGSNKKHVLGYFLAATRYNDPTGAVDLPPAAWLLTSNAAQPAAPACMTIRTAFPLVSPIQFGTMAGYGRAVVVAASHVTLERK